MIIKDSPLSQILFLVCLDGRYQFCNIGGLANEITSALKENRASIFYREGELFAWLSWKELDEIIFISFGAPYGGDDLLADEMHRTLISQNCIGALEDRAYWVDQHFISGIIF